MQDWLSTVISVLVILLIIVFFLRRGSAANQRDAEHCVQQPLPDRESLQTADIGSKPVIPRSEHPISRKQISANALKVLHRLNSQGHEAYLVGGCIRDLYLGLEPKDFDVATSATPEQVRRLFRNSRLIGRRFKLVHILFGRETIEVATFRASHDADEQDQSRSHHSESGRILRDNVYGSMDEDAQRRDFTINALYYDCRDFSLVNHCQGVADILNKQIRLIGDPARRYHEDPVRMLRALRFAARLDFTMTQETAAPILTFGHLLRDIPAARLFDEILKLLQSGYGVRTFSLLREYRLLEHLFPATHANLQESSLALIEQALASTDLRVQQERPVTPAFLFCALLWQPVQRLAIKRQGEGLSAAQALQQAGATVLQRQCDYTAIPKRFTLAVKEIWELQARLERRQPKAVEALLAHPRFRAAYDFLLIRERAGEALDGAGQWWTDIQKTETGERQAMIRSLRTSGGRQPAGNRRRRRRRPGNRKSQGESAA